MAANHTYLIPVALDSLSGALTYENGTVSWNRNKPTKYTLVSGDSGYMVGIKNGVRMGTMSFSLYLSIDNPSATEGVVNIKSSIGAEYSSPATKM